MLSVDADTPMSAIPNTGTWYAGTANCTKYFDISIAGKCETGTSDRVKLDVQPASEIPSFFTKNTAGKIVFAEPQVVGTIKADKGYNSWIQIELKSVNGNIDSDVAKHACLGIKKNDKEDFFDIIHAGNLTSRYVDVTQESHIELVPLLSKTATTENTGYVAVTPGTEITFTDITVPTTGTFNFGSVYRINISVHNGQWLTGQTYDLSSISNGIWNNLGRMGAGLVMDQNGVVHENQLLAINYTNGTLAYSSDGAHWIGSGNLSNSNWTAGPVYGNGIWCAVSSSHGVKRSIDGGKTWSVTLASISTECLNFANGVFMTVSWNDPGIAYTSPDAGIWTQVGSVKFTSEYPRILIYGTNKWICGSGSGCICQSKDNGTTWEEISDGLRQINVKDNDTHAWYGGCYINGYYYAIHQNGPIARSADGVKWKKVFSFDNGNIWCNNITYYKNKLWAFSHDGKEYIVGLFNPDGTIESLEN